MYIIINEIQNRNLIRKVKKRKPPKNERKNRSIYI